jgi:2,3-bisphosphoglycerate-independent phosphoglycerate mutase
MTGFYDSNIEGKMTFAASKIDEYDFGFVHVKAVDDAGHDKDLNIKIE